MTFDPGPRSRPEGASDGRSTPLHHRRNPVAGRRAASRRLLVSMSKMLEMQAASAGQDTIVLGTSSTPIIHSRFQAPLGSSCVASGLHRDIRSGHSADDRLQRPSRAARPQRPTGRRNGTSSSSDRTSAVCWPPGTCTKDGRQRTRVRVRGLLRSPPVTRCAHAVLERFTD